MINTTYTTYLLAAEVHPEMVKGCFGYFFIGATVDTYYYVVPGIQETIREAQARPEADERF